jgi:hypothetical protein
MANHDITEATRCLCATVHRDRKLCDQILEEFLEEDYKAIGVCHGIDIPLVLKNCLFARKRRGNLSILLNGLSIIAFTAFTSWLLAPVLGMDENTSLNIIVCCYFLASIVVFMYELKTRYRIVGRTFSRRNFSRAIFNSDKLSKLLEKFKIDDYIFDKIERAQETQNANVIIYGGFSPFIGAGINIGSWSFSIDISRGKDEIGKSTKVPLSFKAIDLLEYVTNSVKDLKLEKLEIDDNLYVSGREIRDQEEFLFNELKRPITKIEIDRMNYFIENPTNSIRHYRCIKVVGYKSETILSIFYNFSIIGQSLFVEVNYYLLTPVSDDYKNFDTIKSPVPIRDLFGLILEVCIFRTWLASLDSIIHFIESCGEIFNNKIIDKQEEIESNPDFNYGAVTSLRERISSQAYGQYFQEIDKETYLKAIQNRIIYSLLKFLDENNINTSDFTETKSIILNHGIIGSVEATTVAVGKRSKSKTIKLNVSQSTSKKSD